MKRLIALILVVLMLGSTAAFAAETRPTDTMFGLGDGVSKLDTEEKNGNVKTELWLQVDASGQIDVTVPLVLVFRTNIDGGKATAPETYEILNNNNAPVIVTDVVVSRETKTDVTHPNGLALQTYEDNKALLENQYMVQLTVDAKNAPSADDGGLKVFDFAGKHGSTTDGTFTNPAIKGGLFALDREENKATATATDITAKMATGALSFVTLRDANDEMDETKGVYLHTVTYTVAFNTSNAYGGSITEVADASEIDFTGTREAADNDIKSATDTPAQDDDTTGDDTTGGGN